MQPPDKQELPSTEGPASKAAVKLGLVGARTIEIYQNQRFRLDRLWAYFKGYSALLLIVGGTLTIYLNSVNSRPGSATSRWVVLLVPAVAYTAFAAGNHLAMSLALTELRVMRNIAVTKTPYNFKEIDKGTTLWCHFLLAVFVLALYALACYSATV